MYTTCLTESSPVDAQGSDGNLYGYLTYYRPATCVCGSGSSLGPAATFTVVSGPCTTDQGGRCVGRPSGYSNYEDCTITVSGAGTLDYCPLFSTESGFDYVTIDGSSHGGSDCPHGTLVNAASSISWHTDYSVHRSGWEICLEE